jgi:Nucleoside 2-deoxyribosyltransferase
VRRRVYVAGSSAHASTVARYIADLRKGDITITYDWTVDVLKARRAGATDRDLIAQSRALYAEGDIDAIRLANCVWVIIQPSKPGIGLWVELGAALALNKTVIVSGGHGASIFCELAYQKFDTHDEARDWLLQ